MIQEVCRPDGKRGAANIEQHLLHARPFFAADETLSNDGGATHDQSLAEIQFDNTDEDKQEIHGDRAGDFRQDHFEARREQGNDQVGDEFQRIINLPCPGAIDQRGQPEQADE